MCVAADLQVGPGLANLEVRGYTTQGQRQEPEAKSQEPEAWSPRKRPFGAPYATGAGRLVRPIRYSSTDRAAERPSAIAQTISD